MRILFDFPQNWLNFVTITNVFSTSSWSSKQLVMKEEKNKYKQKEN